MDEHSMILLNRQSLILYFQNLRDLEVAKEVTKRKWNYEKYKIDKKMQNCILTPSYIRIPKAPRNKDEGTFLFFSLLAILCVLCLILMAAKGVLIDLLFSKAWWCVLMLIIGVVMFGLYAWSIMDSWKQAEADYKETVRAVEEQNAEINKQCQLDTEEYERLKKERKKINQQYQKRYDYVDSILTHFYSMNIVSVHYRDLPSIIYIYDEISTGALSYEAIILNTHIESGIQRILDKLDQILDKLDDIIYETRCIHAENRDSIQKVINDNNLMLNNLKKIAKSSNEAAQYAQLSANYSEANAFFSMANYLRP